MLSGAGISAESGIPTFRGSDGLWEGHRVEEVASPEGWAANPKLVLDFYNRRRKNVLEVEPNDGHRTLVALEEDFEVHIITQNIDDLHERAGSSRVMHLHGEILKSRSTSDPSLVYSLTDWQLNWEDTCAQGSQLRPHIVWFGEAVPLIEDAALLTATADVFVVVGTSLAVYPAAGLLQLVPDHIPKYLIDPNPPPVGVVPNLQVISELGSVGLAQLQQSLNS